MLALGFDASVEGAAFALLRVDALRREYVDHGVCATEVELVRKLESSKDVSVIGIEIPVGGLGTKLGDDAGSRKRGEALIRTASTAHFVRGYVTATRGKDSVEAMPSYVARKYIGLGRSATDAQVTLALRAFVPTWPSRSNDHHRDAAVVAIAAAMIHLARDRIRASTRA